MRWRPTTDELFPVKRAYLCSFGDDEPTSTAVSTVSNDPWGPQGDAMKLGFGRAEDQFNNPMEYYPGSTVVPWAPETTEGLQGLTDLARGGMPSIDAARSEAASTIGGDYLQRENPHYAALADRTSGDVMQRMGERFGGSVGGYGSPAHMEATARGVGDALAPMQYQAFANERQNQLSLLPQAAQIEMMGSTAPGLLQQVGQAREQQAGAELQDDMNRFDFGQNEPQQRLERYLAAVRGGQFGGTSTSSQPIYSNKAATGLGMASSAASIAGSLFGSGGIF